MNPDPASPISAQEQTQNPLHLARNSANIDVVLREYLELEYRALMMRAAWIRATLGYAPKRCHKCGTAIK